MQSCAPMSIIYVLPCQNSNIIPLQRTRFMCTDLKLIIICECAIKRAMSGSLEIMMDYNNNINTDISNAKFACTIMALFQQSKLCYHFPLHAVSHLVHFLSPFLNYLYGYILLYLYYYKMHTLRTCALFAFFSHLAHSFSGFLLTIKSKFQIPILAFIYLFFSHLL